MENPLIYIRTQRPGIGARIGFIFMIVLGVLLLASSEGHLGMIAFGLVLTLVFGTMFFAHGKTYYDYKNKVMISKWSIYLLSRTERESIPDFSYIAVVSVNVTRVVNSRVNSVSIQEGKYNVNFIFPKGGPERYRTIATTDFKKAIKLAKEIREHTGKRIYMSAGPRKAWVD